MDEYAPVDDGEFVFRRIHRNYFDAGLATPIRFAAFRPNPSDTTGVSVFRAAFGPASGILDPTRPNDYYVAQLPVRALRRLGLTVEADPVAGGPPGHAVLPEIGWPAYLAQKQKVRAILIELAKLGSADIVHVAS